MWARSLDDLQVCPLRAYFSMKHAKSAIPYFKSGFEFQRKVIAKLSSALENYAIKIYKDPGIRGTRTGGQGIRICAKYKDIGVCGRPDFVALFLEPPTVLVAEVQMTSHWKQSLRNSLPRLSFYTQGLHELFGLPISLVLYTPEEVIPIRVDCKLDKFIEGLRKLNELYSIEEVIRKAKNVKDWACANCGFKKNCPIAQA